MSLRTRSRFRRATRLLRRAEVPVRGWRYGELRQLIRATLRLVEQVEQVLAAADHHDAGLVLTLAERELSAAIWGIRGALEHKPTTTR